MAARRQLVEPERATAAQPRLQRPAPGLHGDPPEAGSPGLPAGLLQHDAATRGMHRADIESNDRPGIALHRHRVFELAEALCQRNRFLVDTDLAREKRHHLAHPPITAFVVSASPQVLPLYIGK